jgi:hypothetical protein
MFFLIYSIVERVDNLYLLNNDIDEKSWIKREWVEELTKLLSFEEFELILPHEGFYFMDLTLNLK